MSDYPLRLGVCIVITLSNSTTKYFALSWRLVGREGLEPSMSSGTGATIRRGTNYALPTHIKKIKLDANWTDSNRIDSFTDYCITIMLFNGLLCASIWCPTWDSNPHFTDSKSVLSSSWSNRAYNGTVAVPASALKPPASRLAPQDIPQSISCCVPDLHRPRHVQYFGEPVGWVDPNWTGNSIVNHASPDQ